MFQERLESIRRRLDGAIAVSLVAADGIPVETAGEADGLDLDALAALTLAQIRHLGSAPSDLQLGRPLQLVLTTERCRLLATHVGKGYYLMLVLGVHGSLGRASYEARRARLAFEGDLA